MRRAGHGGTPPVCIPAPNLRHLTPARARTGPHAKGRPRRCTPWVQIRARPTPAHARVGCVNGATCKGQAGGAPPACRPVPAQPLPVHEWAARRGLHVKGAGQGCAPCMQTRPRPTPARARTGRAKGAAHERGVHSGAPPAYRPAPAQPLPARERAARTGLRTNLCTQTGGAQREWCLPPQSVST
jgi:hypothetical protein